MGALIRMIRDRAQKQPRVPLIPAGLGPVGAPVRSQDYLEAYKGWVYAVVRRIAETAAAVDLGLYRTVRRNGRDVDERIWDHPLLDLLNRVNPHMTRFELFERTWIYLELVGEAPWVLTLDEFRRPVEIWPVPPHWVKVVPDRRNLIRGYVYQPPGEQPMPLAPDEVIMHVYQSPWSLIRGMGTVQAAALAIDQDNFMAEWQRNFFVHGAVPLGVLETEHFLSETEYRRLREQWEERHQGYRNAHRIAVLEEGVKFKPLTIPAKDMQLVEARRFVRDEILAMFGVPQALLGLLEDVNRANAEAMQFVFAATTIKPRLIRMEQRLNEFLVPRYGDPSLFVKFDDPVPEDRERRLEELKMLADHGAVRLNELREHYDLPPEPAFNVALAPANYQPVPGTAASSGAGEGGAGAAAAGAPVQRAGDPGAERREARWKRFVERLDPHEQRLKRVLKRAFQEQQNQVSRRIRDGASSPEEALQDAVGWPEQLVRVGGPLIRAALMEAGREAVREVAELVGERAVRRDFEPSPAVVVWLANRIFEFAQQVSATTEEQLRAELIEGYALGERPYQLLERVARVFNEAKGPRAERIARTEMAIAMNRGLLFGYEQSGVVRGKEWVAALDERTRAAHAAADGQVVGLHEKFLVGGHLMDGPGDPTAPAELVVNCRCTVAPVV